MTKSTLLSWYGKDISYNERNILHKIGVGDYDLHYLQDFKQMLSCENWANSSSEIRNKLSGKRIRKIIFFTPNFNDSKPDASNYSCAIVETENNGRWVISYRPSYMSNIQDDIFVKKLDISTSKAEDKLNGDYPILATLSSDETEFAIPTSLITEPFVHIRYSLPSDARHNPDKYILPLDIVSRPINSRLDHFAIYLGNEQVIHLLGGGEPTKFDTWYNFCNPSSNSGLSSSFLWSSGSSNSSSSGSKKITSYRPAIPFKRKEDIIRHIAKVVSYDYGRHSYNFVTNNCEHLVKRCVFSIDVSLQSEAYAGTTISIINTILPLELKMRNQSSKLEKLTSSYSYEKEKIEEYIQEAENNRSYTRSKYQIQQEKFQERIEVYPKDWCRVQ